MKILSILLLLLLTACASGPQAAPTGPGGAAPAALSISSPAFASSASIPQQYTCQGDDTSPELTWSDAPSGTQSFALLMEDPDAPVGIWVHWIVYNLPPETRGLPEGASQASAKTFTLPDGAVQGRTSFNRADYGGPCPPAGSHRYIFYLYALDTTLPTQPLDKSALLKAIEGHVLAQGELVGLYQKQ